ncbi:thiol-disulfide oxidoreductase ResA-like [Ylistrum balloti]|uniref:thiol-disulfide oxidoreductase ResA-like n=1 Tax=Ylistrum balloti TaxID=509963 RepID=UPI0029059D9C|nr:thiol-disulfide oxidoreductase ResA-like [Ylistrum balloti]
MAKTLSTMHLPIGEEAPSFILPSTNGYGEVNLKDLNAEGYLIAFWCNHCPFVKHIATAFVEMIKHYQQKGIEVIVISSNDVSEYPEDRPEKMTEAAQYWGFTFPYLYDESQDIAKKYYAACTPDFFLFDKDKKLFYRGQMDSSRPGNDRPSTGSDLKQAIDHLLAKKPLLEKFTPSMGCNIKWKKGNEPKF